MQQDSCIRDCWGSHVFQSQQALYEGASLVRPPLIGKQVQIEFCAACCNFLCHMSVLLVMFASWSGLIRPPFQTPMGRLQDITGCVWQRRVQASSPDISLHFQFEAAYHSIPLETVVTGPQHARSVQSATSILECPAGFNFDLCQMDVELLMLFCLTIHPADRT